MQLAIILTEAETIALEESDNQSVRDQIDDLLNHVSDDAVNFVDIVGQDRDGNHYVIEV